MSHDRQGKVAEFLNLISGKRNIRIKGGARPPCAHSNVVNKEAHSPVELRDL